MRGAARRVELHSMEERRALAEERTGERTEADE